MQRCEFRFATSANRFLSDRDYGVGGEVGAWRYRPNPEIMDLADLSGLSMGPTALVVHAKKSS